MKLKILLLFLFIIISLNSVKADFNAQRGYEWLINQSNNGSFNDNIVDTSLALLALNSINRVSDVERAANYLETQISLDGCFPRGSCRIKDTALAIIALNEINRNVENSKNWLIRAQTASLLNGNWYFQIVTSDSANCEFNYFRNNERVVRNIEVVQGRFPICNNSTWLNINTCLDSGLVSNNPSLLVDVDCRTLDNAIISLLYNNANSYYVLEEVHNKQADIRLRNGCYGRTSGAGCSYVDTLYADWALNILNSDVNSMFYLDLNYDSTNVLHNSLLHLITERNSYLNALRERQRRDGSFDNSIFNTAFAILASRNSQDIVDNATNWLGIRQQDDGSWQNVADTALVLYATSPQQDLGMCISGETRLCGVQEGVCRGSSETCINSLWSGCNYGNISNFELVETMCDDNLDNDCDGNIDENDVDCIVAPVCNLDGICDFDLGENINNCPEDCLTSTVCNFDDVCDFDLGEDVDNCPSDCETEQDTCSNGIQDDDEEGVDCGGICPRGCPSIRAECNDDGICELEFGENAVECVNDCSCGDNICDTSEDRISCPGDCGGFADDEGAVPFDGVGVEPTKGKFPFWIFGIILIVILGAYIYYKKFIKKPPKQGFGFTRPLGKEKKPRFKIPFFGKKKTGLEEEIDKSIEEAQGLMRK